MKGVPPKIFFSQRVGEVSKSMLCIEDYLRAYASCGRKVFFCSVTCPDTMPDSKMLVGTLALFPQIPLNAFSFLFDLLSSVVQYCSLRVCLSRPECDFQLLRKCIRLCPNTQSLLIRKCCLTHKKKAAFCCFDEADDCFEIVKNNCNRVTTKQTTPTNANPLRKHIKVC